jgi:diadenosine tetraphosphatase ApaH/serine/threonine PP2A family protein phosphatase
VQERMKVPSLEDAVVNAALSLGSNGRGKGGVGGHMVAMASKHPKRFAPLLEMALRLKKSARPNEDCEWRGGKAMVSHEQAVAQCKEWGLPETIVDYLPGLSADELPPLDDGPPSSATDFLDAIIAAARRHGSNGHGKDGVEGYIRKLAHIGCRTFDRWVIRAMVEQVEGRSRAHELSPEDIEECNAELRERGVDPDTVLHAAYEAKYGSRHDELWPDEIEDPYELASRANCGVRRE